MDLTTAGLVNGGEIAYFAISYDTALAGADGEGGPLPGALVSVDGAPSHPEATVDGSYTVARIPAGPARVTVSKAGYVTQTGTCTFTAGQTLALDFYLMHPGPHGLPVGP